MLKLITQKKSKHASRFSENIPHDRVGVSLIAPSPLTPSKEFDRKSKRVGSHTNSIERAIPKKEFCLCKFTRQSLLGRISRALIRSKFYPRESIADVSYELVRALDLW
jgi:hypothetical protein